MGIVFFSVSKSLCIQCVGCVAEGLYVQCFARVYAGDQVQGQQVTEAGHGRDDEKIITLKTDLDSQQTAPHWMDGPKVG